MAQQTVEMLVISDAMPLIITPLWWEKRCNYLSISKRQLFRRWSLAMDE